MLNINQTPDPKIKHFTDLLKFDNQPVFIKGSYSIKNLYYYGDVDLSTNIEGKYNKNDCYENFLKIIENVYNDAFCYYIEFKVQRTDETKSKYFNMDEFKQNFKKDFYDVDFCKIDLVIFIDYVFIEMSCNYQFKKNTSNEDYLNDIRNDVKEQAKEGNYFKALKRLFLISVNKKDYENVRFLINTFNSNLGKKYSLLSNMKAIQLLQHYYNDDITKTRILINLKFKNLNVNNLDERILEKNIIKLSNNINNEAKKIYDSLLYILNEH